jgi:prolyl oligopeptidase
MLICALLLSVAFADDPYAWLEDVEGKKSLAWVKKQDKRSEKELTKDAGYEPLRQRLMTILNSNDRIPRPDVRGDHWYNYWQDASHVQGVWRRTTRDSYAANAPAWEVVLDIDALSVTEGKHWVWHGASCLPPENRRCMVSLSDGGSDADVKREFDLVDKAFVKDGFVIPQSKSDVAWIDQDTLYVGYDWGAGTLTDSGYPRQARRWKRGTPLADAKVVGEGKTSDVSVSAWVDHTPGYHREFFTAGHTFYDSETWLVQGDALVHVDVPTDANVWAWKDWLMVSLRSDWKPGDRKFVAGSLIATKFDDFMAGKREFQPLFTPTSRTSLAGTSTTKNLILLSVLDNVKSRTLVLTPGETGFVETTIAGLPEIGTVSVRPVDDLASDEVFVDATGFLQPPTLSIGSAVAGSAPPTVLKALPAQFDSSNLDVQQFEATSADGTKVPYFQVSKKDLKLDGNNPTVVDGYGGFEVSLTPNYSGGIGAAWLERGGVYVLANIRGGGEFGPTWHQAALKANRHKAYEDFAAVSQDLITRKVSSPEHLGAKGGSNGGLLMGNMAIGWPQLYKAILCQVPLLDMQRYSHLLAGASWMGEYGDPDDPEQWKFIQSFSPYHLVKPGVRYPRILFTTSTRDDRVHPGHARKMAAKMLDLGDDVLYWENTEGGHGGAANNEQRAKMWALSWTFLWNELNER